MEWVKAKYSKGEIKKAGEMLVDKNTKPEQHILAMGVLSNWRAAHAYPMHAILITLRNIAHTVDKNAIVAQRLKRTPSIVGKIVRYPSMSLARMQDIAGCRAVVRTARDARALALEITASRTRNKLHKKDDYIAEPKSSGYRGIHLIYKYNGEKLEYSDYFVEIQLRSKIQHAWATAVEIIDTFTNQALKASKGGVDWLDFFRYVSIEFAKIEKCPTGDIPNGVDPKSEVVRLAHKLNVVNILGAFAVSTNHITRVADNKNAYFLLELTDHASKIRVTYFKSTELESATQSYLVKEEQAKVDNSYNVVLVAANSLKSLKKAYPNYFADSKDFLRHLSSIIGTN